ncbi:hypothetical protein MSNKSG1_05621 [Marinobacter santoriniensis NKSG1]|jgi:hypothetical protein|uniref:ParD-like antitoxin of type II toxin-antitoxin system n=1 Tax=Marinobacter santoriniensis NKSG1 TaxID=1288826 RepID=M7D7R6_9GAMM|nr:hypothetical protein [Marinobacter santoriniensis]EMP56788.1 hypothetical protein MSNKSG1_05621 [Marinobacter santoriniensis NKSG1]
MAKAQSPLRLEAGLVEKATLTGRQMHRSTAEQIEYWAEIGQRVSRVLSPEMLTRICSGLARIQIEAIKGEPVNPDAVFAALDQRRQSGELARQVTGSGVRYQASASSPGLLEEIDGQGNVRIGHFLDGQFVPEESEATL